MPTDKGWIRICLRNGWSQNIQETEVALANPFKSVGDSVKSAGGWDLRTNLPVKYSH